MTEATAKEFLGWAFTLGSLEFAGFALLFSLYVSMTQSAPTKHPRADAAKKLIVMCRLLAVLIASCTGVAAYSAVVAGLPMLIWVLVGSLGALCVCTLYLSRSMR